MQSTVYNDSDAEMSTSEPSTNIDGDIQLMKEVADEHHSGDPDYAVSMRSLAILFTDKYATTENIADLDEAINYGKEAVSETPSQHQLHCPLLAIQADNLRGRYKRTQNPTDLDKAIQLRREFVDLIPRDAPDCGADIASLQLLLLDRYARTKNMDDLNEAIQIAREAMNATPESHSYHRVYLTNLADQPATRYSRTRVVADLDEVIKLYREAVNLLPTEDQNYAPYLSRLISHIDGRYLKLGSLADLKETIRLQKKMLSIVPDDDPHRAADLDNLANQLNKQFERTGKVKYLDQAIEISRKSAKEAANDGEAAEYLCSLGNHMADRYRRLGRLPDLEDSIKVLRKCILITTKNDPSRPEYLNTLGNSLEDRFVRTGSQADIKEAIKLARLAIKSTPRSHPDLPEYLFCLGHRLGRKYSRTGSDKLLDSAILSIREALKMTPQDDPEYAKYMDGLAVQLDHKYSRSGLIVHLEEAITISREVEAKLPKEHVDCSTILVGLSRRLYDRHVRVGMTSDLEEAIDIARAAIELTPNDHPNYADSLDSLGMFLADKYSKEGSISDIDEAIRLARDAINAHTEIDVNHTVHMSNLAMHLGTRYSNTESITDIDEAIELCRKIIDATPRGNQNYGHYLNDLGCFLGTRYSKTDHVTDVDEAITYAKAAVDAFPQNHPVRCKYLNRLGNHLSAKYFKLGSMSDLAEIISVLSLALREASSSASDRFESSTNLLQYSMAMSNWGLAFEIAEVTIDLVSQVSPRILDNSDKQYMLTKTVGLASTAAVAAINAEKGAFAVLNLLERGRGVIATSVEELRVDVIELQEKHPDMAESFIRLRRNLENSSARSESEVRHGRATWNVDARSDQRYHSDKQLSATIDEIRKIPGFGSFLKGPNEKETRAAAKHGPIAVINATEFRCDAILVEEHQIRLLPLPNLDSDKITDMAHEADLGSNKILEWLWDTIADPILTALGLTQPPGDEDWPRMWWVPTGPLCVFPLHAAGRHQERSGKAVCDRVMSSYASSIKALIQGQQRPHAQPSKSNSALLLAMENTPGSSRLPFAGQEVEALRPICKSMAIQILEPQPKKLDVLSNLAQCQIFHFAGHGRINTDDPSKSCLMLQDHKDDPLTVADLLTISLRNNAPFLAYLSACGTGQINDERLFDESLHLISAFQLAGFRHVIGTLWEVNDRMCVDIATTVYESIQDGGMTDRSVCWGLHQAIRKHRDHWINMKTNYTTILIRERRGVSKIRHKRRRHTGLSRNALLCDEDEDEGFLQWVPYAHYGI